MFPQDEKTRIIFGCLEPLVKREKSFGTIINEIYQNSQERFLGIFLFYRPALLVRDVELARLILTQNFNSFHDRGIYNGDEHNPLNTNLFSQEGKEWRAMRTLLTPSFSSGKLKAMFETSNNVGDKMINYLNSLLPESGTKQVNIKEVLTTYAIDLIGSVVFGLDINSYEAPKNQFRMIVEEINSNTLKNVLVTSSTFLCPSLRKFMLKMGIDSEALYKLRDVVKDTIEMREEKGIVRKDILQLLMQLRNQGQINEDDNNWTTKSRSTKEESTDFTLNNIVAQSFIFYIAGQETTAATSSFTIFELAQQPDALQKVQQEVETVLSQHNGLVTYEALQEMEYLDLCIQETLRKYPGLPILNRECTQDFLIPGTDKTINKGTPIIISLLGIQHDAEHFPEPDKYIPERFLKSHRNYNPNAYMPFGEGPRKCIAARMGSINSKLAVVKILQAFNIEHMDRQETQIEPQSVAYVPKGGLLVNISKKHIQ